MPGPLSSPPLRRSTVVLLDFDGPLCSLFAGWPAAGVAKRLLAVLREEGIALPAVTDPHGLLAGLPAVLAERGLAARECQRLIARVDRALTQEEITAARCAEPTSGAASAVTALAAAGTRLGVVSNNARAAIEEYLPGVGLEHLAKHVVGRPADPALMKPDPSGIHEALQRMGVPADEAGVCVYVGDAPTDAVAARAAGIGFRGWTGGSAFRRDRLLAVGVAKEDLFDEWSTFVDGTPSALITAR